MNFVYNFFASYFADAVAAICVFDATNEASYQQAQEMINTFVQTCGNASQKVILALLASCPADKHSVIPGESIALYLNMLPNTVPLHVRDTQSAIESVAKEMEKQYFPQNVTIPAQPHEWMDIKLEEADVDAFETSTSFTEVVSQPPVDSMPPTSSDTQTKLPPVPKMALSASRVPPPVPHHLLGSTTSSNIKSPEISEETVTNSNIYPSAAPLKVSILGSKEPLQIEIYESDYSCCTVTLKPQQAVTAPNTVNLLYMSSDIAVSAVSESKTSVGAILNVVERTLKLRKVHHNLYSNHTFSQTKEICFFQPKVVGKFMHVHMQQHPGGLMIREGHIVCASIDILFIPEAKQLSAKIADKYENNALLIL